MIISFERQFLFVAIPRTATHALREGLRPHLGPRDWEQCSLLVEKRFPIADLAAVRHGHLAVGQVRSHLPDFVWNQLFKFCVVRNPYDRLISSCAFLQADTGVMQRDPAGAIKRLLRSEEHMAHVLLRPQHEFITDAHGKIAVDYVARFERLQADLDAVCSRVGLPLIGLARRNRSRRPNSEDFIDEEIRALTVARYQADFELFGYPVTPAPEGSAAGPPRTRSRGTSHRTST